MTICMDHPSRHYHRTVLKLLTQSLWNVLLIPYPASRANPRSRRGHPRHCESDPFSTAKVPVVAEDMTMALSKT